MFNVFIHVFARLGLMAVITAVGALVLYPLLTRWSWLDDPTTHTSEEEEYCDDPECEWCLDRLFDCDSCKSTYDIKGSCDYRAYDEDGHYQDYLICQGCYSEILDSWA